MNKEDIIRMAREAGLVGGPVYAKGLEAFASLVAAAEREACAKLCEEMKGQCWAYDHDTIAEAIRARGQA